MSGKGAGGGDEAKWIEKATFIISSCLCQLSLLILRRSLQQWWPIFTNWSQSKTENDVKRSILPRISVAVCLSRMTTGFKWTVVSNRPINGFFFFNFWHGQVKKKKVNLARKSALKLLKLSSLKVICWKLTNTQLLRIVTFYRRLYGGHVDLLLTKQHVCKFS